MNLSHKPVVLYRASIERIVSARRLLADDVRDYVMAMYLAGLSVECILQAIALRNDAGHDARHTLITWADKCPESLNRSLNGSIRAEWNAVNALWDNGLRYLSQDGLLGYLRQKGQAYGLAGGNESIIRYNAKRLVDAAEKVHQKGTAQWLSYTKK